MFFFSVDVVYYTNHKNTNEMLVDFYFSEDYQELIEDIVRDGRLYASENHQEILKVSEFYTLVVIRLLILFCIYIKAMYWTKSQNV